MQRFGAYALTNLNLKQLDIEKARFCVAQGLQLSLKPPDLMYEGIFHEQQAYIHSFDGELNLMLESGEQVLHCYERLGFVSFQAEQYEWLAHRLIELGQYKAALEHIEQGERLAQQDQLEEQIAWFLLARARYFLSIGQAHDAFAFLEPMLLNPEKSISSRAYPTCVVLGQTCLEQGLLKQAAAFLTNTESYPPNEVVRLTMLLRVKMAQGEKSRFGRQAVQSEPLILENFRRNKA